MKPDKSFLIRVYKYVYGLTDKEEGVKIAQAPESEAMFREQWENTSEMKGKHQELNQDMALLGVYRQMLKEKKS